MTFKQSAILNAALWLVVIAIIWWQHP